MHSCQTYTVDLFAANSRKYIINCSEIKKCKCTQKCYVSMSYNPLCKVEVPVNRSGRLKRPLDTCNEIKECTSQHKTKRKIICKLPPVSFHCHKEICKNGNNRNNKGNTKYYCQCLKPFRNR